MNNLIRREGAEMLLTELYESCTTISELYHCMDDNLKRLPSAQQWTPVKKNGAFPKEGETVLITNDKGHVKYGQYRGIDFWTDYGCYWWWKKNTTEVVRAWMPKPEPFHEDKG